jgi:hypothetical protein
MLVAANALRGLRPTKSCALALLGFSLQLSERSLHKIADSR